MSTRPVARIPGTATRSVDLFLLPVKAKWLVAPSPALVPMPDARLYILSRWPECHRLNQSATFLLRAHLSRMQLRSAGNGAFTWLLNSSALAALLGHFELFPPFVSSLALRAPLSLCFLLFCVLFLLSLFVSFHSFSFFSYSFILSLVSFLVLSRAVL